MALVVRSLEILAVAFLMNGCVSSPSLQATSILDGSWNEVSTGCVSGTPTPQEQRINEALKSGQVSARMTIDNGMGHTEIVTRQTPPKNENSDQNLSYCKLTMLQRWSVIGSHVEVTDQKIQEQGFNGNHCQGTHQIHDPRVHNYVLRGTQLTVYMNSGLTVNPQGDGSTITPSRCPGGEPQTVVFQRE